MKLKIIIILLLFTASSLLSAEIKTDPDLETKIGQMLFIGFRGTDLKGQNHVIKQQLESGEIGGILFLRYNISNPSQLNNLIAEIKSIKSRFPLFIAIDQEGGKIGRLKKKNGFEDFPSNRHAAKTFTALEAYDTYFKMAEMIKKTGFNINFAPVVDLDINPDSPAIGRYERSFSGDPDIVVKYAKQFIKAHRNAGVLTSIKHFPGHGSANEDSHLGLTDITSTWKKEELHPYKNLISENMVDSIMTAHIMNLNIDDKFPVSLSEKHINNNLREKMNYDGVIISDDLQMGAVSKMFEFEEIVINTVNAGCDILLFANFFDTDNEIARKAKEIIINAVKAGRIKKENIDNSFKRIIRLKEKLK